MRDSTTPKPDWDQANPSSTEQSRSRTNQDRRRSSLTILPALQIANSPAPGLNSWSNSIPAASSSAGAASPSKSSHDPYRSPFSRRRSIGAATRLTSPDGPATRTTPLERPSGNESRSARHSPTLSSPTKRRSQHSSPTSRSTNRSPPPILRADSIPTLPRLTYDPVSASTVESVGPRTPLSPTGGNFFATISGDASRSAQKEVAQGVGVQFGSNISPRVAVAAEGGTASRGERGEAHHDAGMSSRRRSMSSSNAQQPHEAFSSRNNDTGVGSRMSDENGTDAPRGDRREQDKKTMLSKALQKAHTAVLLDNAHNIEGAIEAYEDACGLLGQVLIRSAGEDDRRKLDAIRTTYTNRIQELHQLNRENINQAASQANPRHLAPLPARPLSDESLTGPQDTPHRSLEPEPRTEQLGNGQHVSMTRSSTNTVTSQSAKSESSAASQPRLPEPQIHSRGPSNNSLPLRQSQSEQPPATFRSTERFLTVGSPMDASYAPPPLSPRRLQPEPSGQPPKEQLPVPPRDAAVKGHSRGSSGNSISWLDTIDESGGSSDGSSVHSLRKGKLQRKHVRVPSGDTEAEFDAALDAAVEAAYADGMEPYDYDEGSLDYKPDAELSAPVKAMVDTERKRLSDRSQIIQQAHARTKQLTKEASRRSKDLYRLSDHADEEERILEEISKDFGFDFGLSSKSNSQPRQSDSSEYSGGSTYHSSTSSSKNTAMTSLSTVTESDSREALPKANQNLPRLSEEDSQRDPAPLGAGRRLSVSNTGSVRSRRMSGQNAKQLMIETQIPARTKIPAPAVTAPPSTLKVDDSQLEKPFSAKSDTQLLPDSVFKPTVPIPAPLTTPLQPPPQTFVTESSPPRADSPASHAPIPSPSTPAPPIPHSENGSPRPDVKQSKDRPNMLKKNKSSVSLKTRTLSMSSPDGSEISVGTPLSTTFSGMSTGGSKKNMTYTDSGAPPTPGLPNFGSGLSQTISNVNIFESDLHSPYVPGSPNPMTTNAPIPLEPCPDSHLLRPYWLMRCFYQTIAHPRGGYLSTKLFVPRDVWRVKGVKIKGMDDKIANCDYLTSALQKLNNVDTFDADALMDEMQQFEVVLDHVQSNLSKKLGNEVSVQGIQTLFKDAPVSSADSPLESSSTSAGGRAVSQGKSFVTSWRKLRSKSSAVSLTSSMYTSSSGKSAGVEAMKDTLSMSTLPMTSLPNPRFAKRDVGKLEVSGPHKEYMESLARLFDAVQIIDQIARQVEDPGLKSSSPTHVGLELSTRHASEFFGFYICRFVLTDLTMLLDKFIKRGSEWVLV